MRTPRCNTHPSAVTLREAAQAFGRLGETTDQHDIAGQAANRRLLDAAIAYAAAVSRQGALALHGVTPATERMRKEAAREEASNASAAQRPPDSSVAETPEEEH